MTDPLVPTPAVVMPQNAVALAWAPPGHVRHRANDGGGQVRAARRCNLEARRQDEPDGATGAHQGRSRVRARSERGLLRAPCDARAADRAPGPAAAHSDERAGEVARLDGGAHAAL